MANSNYNKKPCGFKVGGASEYKFRIE